MKRLTILNKIFGFLIGSILALILLLALPIGCKSVHKAQSEKTESATVNKSDSSSSKSYSYTDTTKTDSSTIITKTEVTIDSVEYDYVPKGDYPEYWVDSFGAYHYPNGTVLCCPNELKHSSGNRNTPIGKNANNIPEFLKNQTYTTYIANEGWVGQDALSGMKAKGIKITTTTIKQAATQAKGVAIKEDSKQADIKVDSGFSKRELSKETTKKPSIWTGVGLAFGFAVLIGLIWLVIWVWRKKRSAVKTIAGKIF